MAFLSREEKEFVDRVWARLRGKPPRKPAMTYLELSQFYRWFRDTAKEHYIDPEAIDFEGNVGGEETYTENQKKLAGLMGVPAPGEEVVEEEPTSIQDLLERVGTTLPPETDPMYSIRLEEALRELVERLETAQKGMGKVEVVSRDKQGRPRKVWMGAEKVADIISQLNRQVAELSEQVEARRLEVERLKITRVVTVRFKRDMPAFIAANMKQYGPFRAGEIGAVPEANAAILIQQGIAEAWAITPPGVPTRLPPAPRVPVSLEVDTAEPTGTYNIFIETKAQWLVAIYPMPSIGDVEDFVARGEEEYEAPRPWEVPEEAFRELPEPLRGAATLVWTPDQVSWKPEAQRERLIYHTDYVRDTLELMSLDDIKRVCRVKKLSPVGRKEELIDRILGITPAIPPPPPTPPAPPPVKPPRMEWTRELEMRLRDLWTQQMERGIPEEGLPRASPHAFAYRFRLKVPEFREMKTREEMEEAAIELARKIIRERATLGARIRAPARPPLRAPPMEKFPAHPILAEWEVNRLWEEFLHYARIRGIPEAERMRGQFWEAIKDATSYDQAMEKSHDLAESMPSGVPPEWLLYPEEIPKKPISALPFPRAPTSEEKDKIWRNFRYELASAGIDFTRWIDAYNERVNMPFASWEDFLKVYTEFLNELKARKETFALPIHLVRIPMPWREKVEEGKYDAICHFIATKLYPTMDELIDALYKYGAEVSEEEVKASAKRGWKEKNIWFLSVPKEFIEDIIGEPVS